ncbi:hypothetical protein HDG35_005334 [Paraburkholderia sp. JPY681]|uniref:Uncharacterized protein n=1 Tax=Paraburkholderia atlantica TaxID=2654982 RepID=D5WBN2_PARAM|nr:hypothetical protein BC1002_2355 [Paraburkholderia atlantica]MBB5509048.1 hypothetical protein [Paraburkholderia atlantica]
MSIKAPLGSLNDFERPYTAASQSVGGQTSLFPAYNGHQGLPTRRLAKSPFAEGDFGSLRERL